MERTVAGILARKGGEVVAVRPDDTVFSALEKMAEHNVGAVVVLDGDRLAGIMSERDYARKVILLDRGSKETPVADIMTTEVVTVGPATTVTECMELMTERRIRHLPVLDEGRLVGIVSIGDVVKAVIADQRDLIDQLERYITS
ncbi:MAG TPA: CBS domain-containing protein [Actinobacteria bacterium]|nr:CBS domain-containing protein [Actinomycetota bacterium]